MSYNPSTGVYSLPPIYLAVPGTVIIAAQHNDPLEDLATANNYARPVIAGGTGANNPTSARDNLGLEIGTDILGIDYAPQGLLYGLTLSNNTGDPTNDLDFAAGVVASDETTPIVMHHSAGTAELDVAYGTGSGGRFDASISDGTWNCFVISDGTTVSRGFSKALDPTGEPNYPSGYLHYRRVGSIMRASGAIVKFIQYGDDFWRDTIAIDVSVTNPGTSAVTRTLSVPTGIKVKAWGTAQITISTNTATNFIVLITSLDQTDSDPASTGTTAALTTINPGSAQTQRGGPGYYEVMTNTSAQVRSRLSQSGAATNFFMQTIGWTDTRGRT